MSLLNSKLCQVRIKLVIKVHLIEEFLLGCSSNSQLFGSGVVGSLSMSQEVDNLELLWLLGCNCLLLGDYLLRYFLDHLSNFRHWLRLWYSLCLNFLYQQDWIRRLCLNYLLLRGFNIKI